MHLLPGSGGMPGESSPTSVLGPMEPSPSQTRVDSGGAATPQGDFRNGATQLWVLDADDLIPGGRWEMPHDDPTSGLAGGPIAAGDIWLANVLNWATGGALVGIHAPSGRILWSLADTGWGDCVVAPSGNQFWCTFGDGTVAALDPATGERQKLLAITPETTTFAVATSEGSLILEILDSNRVGIYGLSPDGAERFHRELDVLGIAFDTRPVQAVGNQVSFSSHEETVVVDMTTGADVGRFDGSVALTGKKTIVKHPTTGVLAASADLRIVGYPITHEARVFSDEDDTVGVLSGPEGVSLCDPTTFQDCSLVKETAAIWSPSGTVSLHRILGSPFLVYEDSDTQSRAVIDVGTGELVGIGDSASGWKPSPAAGRLLPGVLDRVVLERAWDEEITVVRHPLTGSVLGSQGTRLNNMVTAEVAPGYAVFGWTSEAEYLPPQYLAAYVGATSPTPLALPGARATTDPPPAGLPACPGDTFLLAYATFPNGSITVCGYFIDQPTAIIHSSGGQVIQTSDVTYDGDSTYLGRTSDGRRLRFSFDSGLFEVTDGNGHIVSQQRLDVVWFVAFGRQRPQTGRFDVALPDATAEDQVRYLAELLTRSRAARSSLVTANTALLECRQGQAGDYSAEVTAIDEVTLNRAQLLSAFASAPVDLVPDGPLLLEELRVAIMHSLDADVAFAAWARGINRNGCTGASTEAGIRASELATAAKKQFVAHWNQAIVPRFAVDTLSYTDV